MPFHKTLQNGVSAHSETAIAIMSAPTVIGVNIIAQVLVFWLAGQAQLFPGVEVFLSMTATCSEIIAGLYGTTLNVLITLTISISLMYVPVPTDETVSFFYRLFCNEFVLFLAFSIVLILYYSILVVNPNCIEKEAAKLKRKLSHRGPAGSAAEFISLYDRIETACNNLLPANVLHQLHENKGKRFEYTLALLGEQSILMLPLLADLTRIHRYYECVINCTPLRVSEEMCILARRVCAAVEDMSGKRSLKDF